MANTNWSKWYREGTVNVVKGSKIITGTDTYFLSAGLHAGDIFSVDSVKSYEVDSVTDNTHITLTTSYAEESQTGAQYMIMRQFNATMPAEIAAKTAGLLGDFVRYIDTEMATIHGKSAYELAKLNGYVGTEEQWVASLKGDSAYQVAKDSGYTGTQNEWLDSLTAYGVAKSKGFTGTIDEWLESLKAAGEWSKLDERTQILSDTYDPAALKNCIYRGKSLGKEFTAEQAAAISSGTFEDMWLGDYWEVDGYRYQIAGFDYFYTRKTGGSASASQDVHNLALLCDSTYDSMMFWENPVHDNYTWSNIDWTDYSPYTSYDECSWYTDEGANGRSALITKLEEYFGEAHLWSWSDISWEANTNGVYTGYHTITGRLEVPTIQQMLGYRANLPNYSKDSAESAKGWAIPNFVQFPLTMVSRGARLPHARFNNDAQPRMSLRDIFPNSWSLPEIDNTGMLNCWSKITSGGRVRPFCCIRG